MLSPKLTQKWTQISIQSLTFISLRLLPYFQFQDLFIYTCSLCHIPSLLEDVSHLNNCNNLLAILLLLLFPIQSVSHVSHSDLKHELNYVSLMLKALQYIPASPKHSPSAFNDLQGPVIWSLYQYD